MLTLTVRIRLDDGRESDILSEKQLDIISGMFDEKIPKKKFNELALERLTLAGMPVVFAELKKPTHGFNNALEPTIKKYHKEQQSKVIKNKKIV